MTVKATRQPRPKPPTVDTCSLRLRINSTFYAVRPVRCDCEAERCFELKKLDGSADPAVYHVSQHEDHLRCTCGDFMWRHMEQGSACKHAKSLVALGLLTQPTPDRQSPTPPHGSRRPAF